MPKVEQYGQSRVTSRLAQGQRLNTPRVPDTSLAPGINNLVTGIGEAKQRIDETAAEEALIQFEREKNKVFFDPENGYFNKQGKDAYELAEPTTESITKLQQQYANGLKSEEARQAFNRAAGVHVTRAMADITRHSSKGLEAYEVGVIEARAENAMESAALYWNNPNESAVQRAVGRDSVMEVARRQGMSPEATNEMLQNFESSFTKTQIMSALGNDILTANEMFDKMGSRLEPQDRAEVESELGKANFDAVALRQSQAILGNGQRTLGEMMAEVDAIAVDTPEDAKMKSEIQRQVKNQYTLNKTIREEAEREIYEGYGKAVQDGQITSRDIPAADWDAMTLQQRKNIHKLEKSIAEKRNIETDFNAYTEVFMKTPKELAKVDPLDYVDRLSNSDYKKLVTAVTSARSGGQDHTNLISDATQLNNTMTQIFGKKKSELNSKQMEQYNSLSRAMQVQLEQTESELGRELKPTEKDELYQSFARKRVVEKDWWPDQEQDIRDYSPDQIDMATQYLNRLNRPINSLNLITFIENNPNLFGGE